MMSRKKLLLLLVLFLGIGISAMAQSGRIVGIVLEEGTNEPLIGATVFIVGTTQGASTDLDGNFRILNVRPGTYTLEFRYIGYQTSVVEGVLVRTDLNTEVNAKLMPQAFEGQEIVVQASQDVVIRDLTSSESRINRDQIEKLPVQEVGDIIQLQAGVTVGPGGGIHIRGGRTTEVAYIVDGVRVTDDYDRAGSGLRIENQSIEELQVVSGTFNAEFGQAMSGIVNIVTRAGSNEWRSNLNIWGGDYGTRDVGLYQGLPSNFSQIDPMRQYNVEGSVSGPIIKDKLTFFLSGRRFHNTGWFYGRNAYSPRGPLLSQLDVEGNRTWEPGVTIVPADNPVNKFGELVDENLPWYTIRDRVNIDGVEYLYYEDSGKRDSSLVAMNPFDTFSGQINLQYNQSRMLRFNLIGNYSQEWGNGYNHGNRLVPMGRSSYERNNYYLNLRTTVTPSNVSYFTSNLAIRRNAMQSSLYDSPFDPRYLNFDRVGDYLNYDRLPSDFYYNTPGRFSRFGTDNSFFERSTVSYVAKVEYSRQINNRHFIKSGVELQADVMQFDSFGLQSLELDNINLPDDIDPNLASRLELGVPLPNTPGREQWTRKPVLFAAFIQDRIEYESLIINAGVRFDYFQPNARVPVDTQNPELFIRPNDRDDSFWTEADTKTQISPRFGLAYPISSRGVIHFSYGYFFQIPEYNKLYNSEHLLVQSTSGFQGIFGNPNLKPERSVKYEIGIQQELFTGFALNVTAFYEDKRDYVSSGPLNLTSNPTVRYGTWVNRDYANIRGLTAALNQRVSGNLTIGFDYTFSIAEDSNSDPSAEFFAAIARDDDSGTALAKFLTPTNWDRTHVFNSALFYSGRNWGFNILQRFSSGLPYTPGTDIPRNVGLSASSDVLTNSIRMPYVFSLDLSMYKSIQISGRDLRLNMNIYNLLDKRNINSVYADSGVPTGPLRPPSQFDPGFYESPTSYSEPRRIQLGIQYSF